MAGPAGGPAVDQKNMILAIVLSIATFATLRFMANFKSEGDAATTDGEAGAEVGISDALPKK